MGADDLTHGMVTMCMRIYAPAIAPYEAVYHDVGQLWTLQSDEPKARVERIHSTCTVAQGRVCVRVCRHQIGHLLIRIINQGTSMLSFDQRQ